MIKSSVNLKLYTKCICSVIAQIILYNMNKQTRDLSKYFNEIAPKTKESYKYIFLKFSMMYRHHILLTILSCLFKCTELQSWRFYEEFLVHLLSCCPNKKIFNTVHMDIQEVRQSCFKFCKACCTPSTYILTSTLVFHFTNKHWIDTKA